MKKEYLDMLAKELKIRTYNFIKDTYGKDVKLYDLYLKKVYTNNNELYITVSVVINIPDDEIYWDSKYKLDKSNQIEFLRIKDTDKLIKFINNIPTVKLP